MATQMFTIDGELPGLNEIIDAAKASTQKYARIKRECHWMVAAGARRIKPVKRVDIAVTWYCKNKRKDKDNIAAGIKYILDGLQECGVLENDGWKQISDITHKFVEDKQHPRIEVELTEVLP